jgi:hypothetical protein
MKCSLRVSCVAAILFVLSAAQSYGDIYIPPDLVGQYGATYQLVFVTDAQFFTAPSTDIAYYNTLVQNEAAAAGAMTEDWGLAWKAIGSASNGIAKENAKVYGPVYLLNGTKVADDETDMWDGSIDAAINYSERQTTVGANVFTGSDEHGSGYTDHLLGSHAARVGRTNATDKAWLNSGQADETQDPNNPLSQGYHYYALSPLLTVPVPEPSSVALWLCVAGVGVFVGVRNRRKGRESLAG